MKYTPKTKGIPPMDFNRFLCEDIGELARPKEVRACAYCKKPFERWGGPKGRAPKYCLTCSLFRGKPDHTFCLGCAKKIDLRHRPKHSPRLYCGDECKEKVRRKYLSARYGPTERHCRKCGEKFALEGKRGPGPIYCPAHRWHRPVNSQVNGGAP